LFRRHGQFALSSVRLMPAFALFCYETGRDLNVLIRTLQRTCCGIHDRGARPEKCLP
jgi:hypothetical protein